MLELKKIKKEYTLNNFKQVALNKVSLKFRSNEFVSILGPSGSGKTTLLNIVGGLDTYTSGDLVINGISTKNYKDRDWDVYRNHNVGFVFQSYNLIGHQSILSNVELALTISGISPKERRARAITMLEKVGLKDHVNKKPNQLSGGQMQRVAIARALINDPEILLADEPTGALDTETSEQIMNLLKEIAEDKLVIMVTHNPVLAEKYSTRIVEVLDGDIISDSKPYKTIEKEKEVTIKGKKFMSFLTALNLSFNNLLTKKGRTVMTAFAGSIGIIGIATILSLSNGVQEYIDSVEEETLASYPIVIEKTTVDASSIITSMAGLEESKKNKDDDKIYSNDMMSQMFSVMSNELTTNNLAKFKTFIETDKEVKKHLNNVSYSYDFDLQLYKNSTDEVVKVNPSEIFDDMMTSGDKMIMQTDVWMELFDNKDMVKSQYDVLAGRLPEKAEEVVILVDKNNQISDYTLYTLGLKDQAELEAMMKSIMEGGKIEEPKQTSYTHDELLDLSFKLVFNTDYYENNGSTWTNKSEDADFMLNVLKDAPEIEVVGIIKASEDSNVSSNTGAILYTSDLTKLVIEKVNDSELAKKQIANPETNVLTGIDFEDSKEFDIKDLTQEEQYYLSTLSPEELQEVMKAYTENAGITYDDVLLTLGVVDINSPSTISLYPKDFEAKEQLEDKISEYNKNQESDEDKITYTDFVGIMMKSVTTIVDMITYVLIAFVSISLIVSSIMIGIITYISVLERTKEIGILRAIGASKKDISRVFNAETFIVGLFSGVLGIGVTLLINILANVIIEKLTDVQNLAVLPVGGGIVLIIISVILTLIAGLIPSKMASKKNPVESLRTE